MRITEEELVQMETDGATIRRNPPNRPKQESMVEAPPPPPPVSDPNPEPVQPSVEGEAMRLLVAQNSEALNNISEALRSRKQIDAWDAELVRDDTVEGEYKPLTHVKLRAVRANVGQVSLLHGE